MTSRKKPDVYQICAACGQRRWWAMLDIGAGWKYYCRTCYNAMRRED
jgi:hypothetical protein